MSTDKRRLAAIMFTDMVGYTALTQADEANALKVLEKHNDLLRPIFPQYNGREIKTMGDSFLVEFDSALEATTCAIEIQRILHDYNATTNPSWKITLRIGVHLGDIVHRQGDTFGDAVNIASRIEPLSPPEGVCVSGQIFDQVRNKISRPLVKLDRKELKNVQFQLDVYRIVMPWEQQSASQDSANAPSPLRVAVLPFANMSPDPADEYFADGLTEELIDRLSQLRELRVIARTSVMSYKKKEKKISEIAKELGAGTLVEGSVRKAGNRIRITVQMVDGRTEEHVWSSRYDKDLDDVFAIQTEISEKVTEQAKIQLLESEKHRLEKRPTENTEAYTLYLKGRYYWNERNAISIRKGIAYLEKATAADPSFALAYSDLAVAYVIAADYSIIPADEAFAKIEEYSTRALEMDPGLSDPHAALAMVYERRFEWADAEREFRKAIELNTNNSTARHWYALHLFLRGKNQKAIQEWRKAKEADPLSLIIGSAFGYALVRTGSADEGIEMQRIVIEMNETFQVAHRNLGYSFLTINKNDEAALEARKLLSLSREPINASAAASVLAMAGFREEATSILEELINRSHSQYVDSAQIAALHAALGNETEALKSLQKAVDEKSAGVPYVFAYPSFDSFKNNPNFRAIVDKTGFW